MTQTAGTTDTFDSAALKESLDSVIWDLFPADTYFISNVDKVNVGNTQHQWVFDTLKAAAANKQIGGRRLHRCDARDRDPREQLHADQQQVDSDFGHAPSC